MERKEVNWKVSVGFLCILIGNLAHLADLDVVVMDLIQGFCVGAGIAFLLLGCMGAEKCEKLKTWKRNLLKRK